MNNGEAYLDSCHNWYVRADVYDVDDMSQRIAFIYCIVQTESGVITNENFDEIMYEQLKKPYLDNINLQEIGVREGIVFDITSISYLGEEAFIVQEEVVYEDIEEDDYFG